MRSEDKQTNGIVIWQEKRRGSGILVQSPALSDRMPWRVSSPCHAHTGADDDGAAEGVSERSAVMRLTALSGEAVAGLCCCPIPGVGTLGIEDGPYTLGIQGEEKLVRCPSADVKLPAGAGLLGGVCVV